MLFPDERAPHWLAQQFDAVPPDWRRITEPFRTGSVGQALIAKVEAAGEVYPPAVFNALTHTRFEQVRVVILGQDPYHGPGQAHGLAFSVPNGVAIPPSLRNIRKELVRSLALNLPEHGNLQAWADRGVLLLNTVLTVSPGQAASHANWGWEGLTDALISAAAEHASPKVFMLWGAHAQKKRALIEASPAHQHHLILQANHPSPLSASRPPVPFIGCDHFAQAQAFFAKQGQALDWSLA